MFSDVEICRVEVFVNVEIFVNVECCACVMFIEDVQKIGVMMLFGGIS